MKGSLPIETKGARLEGANKIAKCAIFGIDSFCGITASNRFGKKSNDLPGHAAFAAFKG
jgi:hypothetical protein